MSASDRTTVEHLEALFRAVDTPELRETAAAARAHIDVAERSGIGAELEDLLAYVEAALDLAVQTTDLS